MADKKGADGKQRRLRSRDWFDAPGDPTMAALYLERYLNFGLTLAELHSNRPIIGIAQTGSDLSPCNRHHLQLADRVRDGIRDSGGIPIEFPVHPIQETGKRPTAALDRNLAYLSLVESLYGYFFDGVVLTTGCDKTTPAMIMGACTVNIPSIVLSGGPMLDGHFAGGLAGSGTIVWYARQELAAGRIDLKQFVEMVASSAPSVGHCNTMGTALSMNSMAEALGLSLTGCAAIPGPYRERGQMAYETGKRIVDMVWEDLKPSDILTRKAFENAIVAASALGASTNCPPHVNAIARHIGVKLDNADWDKVGYDIQSYDKPMLGQAGFAVLSGNLFDSAIMKTSVISDEFRKKYLERKGDPDAFEGTAIVFEGPEDYHHRINDPALPIDENSILFIRNVGPVGYPGAAEVVNMLPPDRLVKGGVVLLPCVGDGRQSGTSASPSILNASPEAAVGGGLALLRTGDKVRIDIGKRSANMLISDEELTRRRAAWKPHVNESQTPWQELQRKFVGQLASGACLDFAVNYQRIVETKGVPRHSH